MYYEVIQEHFEDIHSSKNKELNLALPKNLGHKITNKITINKDILLHKHQIYANDNILLKKPFLEFDCFCLNFTINANAKIIYSNIKDEIIYKNSQAIIGNYTSSNIELMIGKNTNLTNIALILSPNFLLEHLPKYSQIKEPKLLHQIHTNPKINALAKEIFLSKMQGSLEKLYIESKILQIIALVFLELNTGKTQYKIKFSNYDINSLYEAREILESSYQNPPSIKELSRRVHLNDFKLKFGYKKLFKQTLYQSVLSTRMLRAKELLAENELNLTQISQEIGYKNIQSFNTAFLKYFGIKPKAFKG